MTAAGGHDDVRQRLDRAPVLLLDFDGPVCAVFTGVPDETVAGHLRTVLADGGHTDLPNHVATATDPFDVLRHAATLGTEEARYVEAAFTAHEVDAITTAAPTPGAEQLMRHWHDSGRPLAIVSNNSEAAVSAYLDLHDLRPAVDYIAARASPDPALLKPSTHLLNRAMTAFDVAPDDCALLGDSVTDIEAAHAAGVAALGYANKPGKRAKLAEAGADAVTETLSDPGDRSRDSSPVQYSTPYQWAVSPARGVRRTR
ncbi:HAD family hydrolase [Amycolatopsis cihanbeyliensis]|uniref:HAD superfamily hydrolase (TIGR01509 family) n=1 Tax=Amycolatopsis cihanbeyliensis TaxID=1128664 RepID=A0A542DKR3_AMYCI|nr:HAD family hydrolase [Amycolatopsis cihanbeyliensis]TQJ03692.1 HAD superfamily hydrolase (TIGR01509 family) [Amycolatopsis cihanbeyliensis]